VEVLPTAYCLGFRRFGAAFLLPSPRSYGEKVGMRGGRLRGSFVAYCFTLRNAFVGEQAHHGVALLLSRRSRQSPAELWFHRAPLTAFRGRLDQGLTRSTRGGAGGCRRPSGQLGSGSRRQLRCTALLIASGFTELCVARSIGATAVSQLLGNKPRFRSFRLSGDAARASGEAPARLDGNGTARRRHFRRPPFRRIEQACSRGRAWSNHNAGVGAAVHGPMSAIR